MRVSFLLLSLTEQNKIKPMASSINFILTKDGVQLVAGDEPSENEIREKQDQE